MEDLLIGAVESGAGAELEEAAGIGGDDSLGASGLRVMHLFGEQVE